MAGIDKAAIGFSIAIVAIGVAFAMYGDAAQNAGPGAFSPAAAPEPRTAEPARADPSAVAGSGSEKPMKSGWERAVSDQDPGIGHDTHQLAMILAPSANTYSGTLLYDASEDVQLVSLRGPVGADENPAVTYTINGKDIFEITLVDRKDARGEWEFSGNALAVHTFKTTQFVVDYKILDLVETEPMMEMMDEMMEEPMMESMDEMMDETMMETMDEMMDESMMESMDEMMESMDESMDETMMETLEESMEESRMAEDEKEMHMEETHMEDDKHMEEKHMEDTHEKESGPMTHVVDMPAGTSVPGCEETNECYIPEDLTINVGDTVEWVNSDTAAHTVTSGSPSDGPSGLFDSSLVMGSASYSFTFEEEGTYDYFCMVHPWMVGSITVY